MAGNDLEEQQRLAREYQAPLEGPLVGEKKSSQAITEEYAKADPIYIAKTAALPDRYSHYRPILGDGNCGWRAVAFAYFETLLWLGDKAKLESELARLISMNNFISSVGGHDLGIFEDFAEETFELLRGLIALWGNSTAAEELLVSRFNGDASPNIIYHMRLLASTTFKSNIPLYENFIPEGGVQEFIRELEALSTEIDHLGITLLIDALTKPAGLAVEIVYLDRSEGTQVNSHTYQDEDENGVPLNPMGPIIHLLYRPSHYDILYKDGASYSSQPISTTAHNSNIQVNRATSFSQRHIIQNTIPNFSNINVDDMSLLFSIPGFCPPPSSHHGFPSQYSGIEQTYASSPISASVSPGPSIANSSATSNLSVSTNFAQQPSALTTPTLNTPHSSHSPLATFPPTQLPIHTQNLPQSQQIRPSLPAHSSISSHSSHSSDIVSTLSANSSFRPSKYEWEAIADWQEGPVTFQTSTFKNSHYNTAHYNNPNFQPEEWSPDCEEAVSISGRKRSH
ncbi:peptidase C65 Otubain-domain-containing protein [Bisporella sp. PMI_857]|nr:peptidase C65 Otubain-domain-containing protein [Bisporella sp. PMI_857]